ncbi:MAG: hypothetical protein AB7I27_11060 [Bacteriovoracaceae bacterium]
MNNLRVIFILAFITSCNSQNTTNCTEQKTQVGTTSCSEFDVTAIEEIDPVDDITGVPNEALTWDTDIYMSNFSVEQQEKVEKAAELLKKVISSKEFRDRVINYNYNGQNSFVDNQGLSNVQIYQKILNGAEKLLPTKNNMLDVELELYTDTSSTIGYTYPNTVRIWMNTKYFNYYTPYDVTDNLMHEWMHKLGFDHAASWSAARDHSVPYAIGYLVKELSKKNFPNI